MLTKKPFNNNLIIDSITMSRKRNDDKMAMTIFALQTTSVIFLR
jgi:hypothetical protein